MEFTKLHGLGNSYVYISLLESAVFREAGPRPSPGSFDPDRVDWGPLARAVSDPGTGIGADGLILILPSSSADARMRIFNADGSEGEMCGNGIRGVGKYLHDRALVKGERLTVETLAGSRALELFVQEGRVRAARVEMGQPILEPRRIPTLLGDGPGPLLEVPVPQEGVRVTPVSMGNPHAVLFVDDVAAAPVRELGPRLERHPAFPARANVGFARALRSETLELRVWERGSGETRACGTGACAAAVAAHLTGRTGRTVEVLLPGGSLTVSWDESDRVWLQGAIEEVCSGRLNPDWLRRHGVLPLGEG